MSLPWAIGNVVEPSHGSSSRAEQVDVKWVNGGCEGFFTGNGIGHHMLLPKLSVM